MWTSLISLLAVVLAVVALVRNRALTHRVADLEKRLRDSGADQGAAPIATRSAPAPAAQTATPEPETSTGDGPAAPRPWPSGRKLGAGSAALGTWLRENWIYPVAGVALMFAGIFLVQYGIETGLLSPTLRVVLALGLGLLFIALGEGLRRRFGGEEAGPGLKPAGDPRAVLLPSTFSAAGIVVLHAAILAALHLYALIGTTTAFAAMVAVTLGAMALGWVQGPFLAILGVIAGAGVPFVLGGAGTPPGWIFGYFGVLAALGLGIDGLRGWGRVWPVALAAPGAAAVLMRLAGGPQEGFALYLLVVTALAMALPGGTLWPRASGVALSAALRRRGRAEAPVLAAGAMAATSSTALVLLGESALNMAALVALCALFVLATRQARPMRELAALPALAAPVWVAWQGFTGGAAVRAFQTPAMTGIETGLAYPPGAPLLATQVLGLAVVSALLLALLARGGKGRGAGLWLMLAVALPGAVAVALELFWAPGAVLGAYGWALHVMALAALATMAALWAARWPAGAGRELGLGAASSAAFALIALAMLLTLSLTALTVALAVLMASAAWMERRFDLPLMGLFQALAVMVLTWRLVVDPGVGWFLDRAGAFEAALTLLAVMGGPAAALAIGAGLPERRPRPALRAFVETGLTGLVAISAALVLARWLASDMDAHANLGLQAIVLASLSWVQFARARRIVGFSRLRRALGWVLGLCAAVALVLGVFLFSPLAEGFLRSSVAGWPLFNDLLLAYGAPGLVIWWFSRMAPGRLGKMVRGCAIGLMVLWGGLVIRHLWQGANLSLSRGIAEGELYAYTVALLLVGAALLVRALSSGRADLRRAGMALVALAAAKAFLVDAAELGGLLRVFAFLGLGLALAGMAWLDRWARGKEGAQS